MRIISPPELASKYGINFTNPHRLTLEATGRFPRRVKIGARKYGYLENELDAWLKVRAALRTAPQAEAAA
jgi:prophage regulatory protein